MPESFARMKSSRNFLAAVLLSSSFFWCGGCCYSLVKALLRSVAHCGIMGWSLLYARPFWPGPEMRPWQTLAFQRDLFHPPASSIELVRVDKITLKIKLHHELSTWLENLKKIMTQSAFYAWQPPLFREVLCLLLFEEWCLSFRVKWSSL